MFIIHGLVLQVSHQSSLLMTMNPLLLRLKAIWLLPLSHQLERGWPLTTLRKITIFLWWGIKQVNGWDLTLTLGRCVQQTYKKKLKKNLHPPDLTPSVLTDPLVPTGGVWVDGYWLSGTIGIAWRAHPVILILRFISPKHYLFRFSVHLAHSWHNLMCFSLVPRQGKFNYIAHFIHNGNSKCFT